jgi:hypothetical protein
MRAADSAQVRDYFAQNPEQVWEMMRTVDVVKLREVVQAADPAVMRRAALARWKERLGATDEEWRVLAPKLERLAKAQQEARGPSGGGGGRPEGGGRGGMLGGFLGGGGAAAGDTSLIGLALQAAAEKLRTVARDANTPPDEVQRRLDEYRAAREKARQVVVEAERDLRESLTPRQEGILLMAGVLN